MRWRQVTILAGMLLRFFGRRVLGNGPLRSPAVRALVLVAVVAVWVMLAASLTSLTSLTGVDARHFVANSQTVVMVMITLAGLALVKMLFLDAAGLVDLTAQLPVTGTERAAALMLYEAAMVAVLAVPVGCAFVIASRPGPGTGLVALVLPTVLAYLTGTVVFELTGQAAARLGLARVRGHAAIVGLSALVLAYTATIPGFVVRGMNAKAGTDPFVWQTVLVWASRQVGLLAPALGGGLAALALAGAALRLIPRQRPLAPRYLAVLRPAARRRWVGPHDLALLRHNETTMALGVSTVTCLALWAVGTNPMWSLAALAIPSLYHYQAIRHLPGNGPRLSAVATFGRLLKAPLLLLGALAIPQTVAVVLAGATVPEVVVPLGAGLLGIVVATCLGIVFPAENDNPFSAFVALVLAGVTLGLVAAALGILQTPPAVSLAVIGTLLVALVAAAVRQIRVLEARDRHEGIVPSTAQSFVPNC